MLFRHAVHVSAIFGLYLAAAMLLPAFVDLYAGHEDWKLFVFSSFMVGSFCGATAIATRSGPPPFSKRFGFLVVNVLWLSFSVIGALPLWLSSLNLTFAQAIFESVSGITTTGSTVIVGLDNAPPGLLLWRSLICWLGGIGVVALGLFIMPFLRVGGMSFFKMESSDTNEKTFARIANFTRAFVAVYVGITALCTITYASLGMTGFDALNHAMSTIATGGFSTKDASFGYYADDTGLLVAATFFMALCSLPFSILIVFLVRGRVHALRDPQIIVFLLYLTLFSMAAGVYHRLVNGAPFDDALIHAFFNVTSILSTTGYASTDYSLWGPFVVMLAFIATFVGGCSGSTAGGLKAYRFIILFNAIRAGVNRLVYPDAIYHVRYGGKTVDADTQRAIFLFVIIYLLLWVFGSLVMALLGYDFITATSAVITALSNVGPGLGPLIGPVGNFSSLAAPELYLLSVMMLLGRLEILTVLVILTPVFWRR